MYIAYKCINMNPNIYDYSTNDAIERLYNEVNDTINECGLEFDISIDATSKSIVIKDLVLDFDMIISINRDNNINKISVNYNCIDGITDKRNTSGYIWNSSSDPYIHIYICNVDSMKFIYFLGSSNSTDIRNSMGDLAKLEGAVTYGHLVDSSNEPVIYDIASGLYEHRCDKFIKYSISGDSNKPYNGNLISSSTLTNPKEYFITSIIELPIFKSDFTSATSCSEPIEWISTVKDVYFSQQNNLNVGKYYSNDDSRFVAIFTNVLYKISKE